MRSLLSLELIVVFGITVAACSSTPSDQVAPERDSGSSGGSGSSGSGGASTGGTATSSGGASTGGGGASTGGTSSGGASTGGTGGTSSGGTSGTGGASDGSAPQPFDLTSSALVEGGQFDVANTCAGANTSPPLTWTAGPAGTMSYAVVLTDKSNDLVHWVIYDIPSTTLSLPADVQKVYQPSNVAGAKQALSYNAGVRGYLGPCPPMEHTYEFAVYALDVSALPGVTMSTTRPQAVTIIQAHDLAVTTLTGTHAP